VIKDNLKVWKLFKEMCRSYPVLRKGHAGPGRKPWPDKSQWQIFGTRVTRLQKKIFGGAPKKSTMTGNTGEEKKS
jgi:hypothetical protein